MDDLFKKNCIKKTKQRILIFNIISELGDSATIKNIISKVDDKMDSSTIYRIIELFIEKGILEKNINYNDEVYYSIKEEHSHYINCVRCHKHQKIDICPFNGMESLIGYKVIDHSIKIDGICSECQKVINK